MTSLRRFEDARFLTGQGRYTDDVNRPDQLYLHVVRSSHAHGRLQRVDLAQARAVPGVLGVFAAEDLRDLGPIPCTVQVATVGAMRVPHRPALAEGRVRYAGEPIAFVVATTRHLARDAAERVEIEYDPLPAVTEAAEALAAGAPLLWDEVPGNLAYRFEKGDKAATDAALARAAHVVALELVNNRIIVAPIEHRAAIAEYADEAFTLLLSGQGVHGIRNALADTVFCVPREMVRVMCPDVGGGFGVKNGLYPEYIMALWAARQLGRPVKWASEHAEDFLSTAHGRDNRTQARLALDAEGRFLALAVETIANLGAAMATGGPGSSTNAPANALGCGYAIPAVFMGVRGAFTNTVPLDAYRGAGKPEVNYLMERLIEAAAPLLGIDAVTLRRRNLVAAFPHQTAIGTTIDGGVFAGNIDRALVAADQPGFAARRTESEQRGRLRGFALTCFLETARGAPNEGAEIRFEADGRVALLLGTQSNGQGHETSFSADRRRAARAAGGGVRLPASRHRVDPQRQWARRRALVAHRRCRAGARHRHRDRAWPRGSRHGCCRRAARRWRSRRAASSPANGRRRCSMSPARAGLIVTNGTCSTRSPFRMAATSPRWRWIRRPGMWRCCVTPASMISVSW